MANARKSIMVNDEVKEKVSSLKSKIGVSSDLQVIEYLLRIEGTVDIADIVAFMALREKLHDSFKREHKIKS